MPVQDHEKDLEYEYASLKRSIVELAQSSDLQTLIRDFESEINSKRRSSLIRDCSDLISVLEKRGLVDCNSYSLLKRIIERVPPSSKRDNMLARFNDDTSRFRTFAPRNQYAPQQEENPFTPLNPPPRCTRRHTFEVSNIPGVLPEAVIHLISEEIGSKWCDMARKLKLKESEIERIKVENGKDTYQCAQKCLIEFQSRCLHYELEKNLLSALEKTRRNDIRRRVEKILHQTDV